MQVRCSEHGESDWCYVDDDGQHFDSEYCGCGDRDSLLCRVDGHRRRASVLDAQSAR